MRPLQTDLSIYNKFDFERPPVGVKFLFEKPGGIARLDKKLGFCEMLKEAHERDTAFYFDKDNEDCVGKMLLGMIAREVFPEGKVLISIPWNWIPGITKNLNEMEWKLSGYNKEQYRAEMERLGKEFNLGL